MSRQFIGSGEFPSAILPGALIRFLTCVRSQVGELIGGSQREEREDVLLQRMRDSGLDPESYWWYLELRRYGSGEAAPHTINIEVVF